MALHFLIVYFNNIHVECRMACRPSLSMKPPAAGADLVLRLFRCEKTVITLLLYHSAGFNVSLPFGTFGLKLAKGEVHQEESQPLAAEPIVLDTLTG